MEDLSINFAMIVIGIFPSTISLPLSLPLFLSQSLCPTFLPLSLSLQLSPSPLLPSLSHTRSHLVTGQCNVTKNQCDSNVQNSLVQWGRTSPVQHQSGIDPGVEPPWRQWNCWACERRQSWGSQRGRGWQQAWSPPYDQSDQLSNQRWVHQILHPLEPWPAWGRREREGKREREKEREREREREREEREREMNNAAMKWFTRTTCEAIFILHEFLGNQVLVVLIILQLFTSAHAQHMQRICLTIPLPSIIG